MVDNEPLGEHEIIKIIHKRLTDMPDMPVPFGDDVSAAPLLGGGMAVLKTDMLVAATDVPAGMSLFEAARKAIVMNISDFASKGAMPTAAIVALGLPKTLANKKAVTEIADGLNYGAREYGAYVIGGDTNETSDLIISVSLFGSSQNALMLRSGARTGDIVAVTGLFGKTSAGLRLLEGNYKATEKMRAPLVDAVYHPNARLREGLALRGYDYVSSSMDSSDGLAWSLHELGRISKVGFIINKLPVAPEAKEFALNNDLDEADLVFYGGEEYELVLTIKPDKWEEAKAVIEAVHGQLIPIGKATYEKNIILDLNGKKRVIEPRGWEHFKSSI
ncbi:MAG TPA: thiamine-phosphate kinase [Candidatus Acidoferrales bacterium]|nr:thiamine-phosphate kinase [Candidatus Acidoferrales bacterium]